MRTSRPWRAARPVRGTTALVLSLSLVLAALGLEPRTSVPASAEAAIAEGDGLRAYEDPAATVLPASADAYVDSRDADANFGDEPRLWSARGQRMAFVEFDPDEHDGDFVERAKLRLHASGHEGPMDYLPLQVFGISDQEWSESEITWHNAPRFEGHWLEMIDGRDGSGWYEADVTAYVNEHLAAGQPISFRIENEAMRGGGPPAIGFDGRAADENQPELVLFGDGDTSAEDAELLGEGEDGSDLWLRYPTLEGDALEHVRAHAQRVVLQPPHGGGSGVGEVLRAAADELREGLTGLTGRQVEVRREVEAAQGAVLVGTLDGSPRVRQLLRRAGMLDEARDRGEEGFVIASVAEGDRDLVVIGSTGEQGAQYGAFRLLQMAQQGADLGELAVADAPAVDHRMNNHWANYADNVPRGWSMVERGYNGSSFWQMDRPADEAVDRYVDYARANASVGINGTVVNSVNATNHWIREENLPRVAAIADALRPYGVNVYLALRFDSPIQLGGLDTADPEDPDVRDWWEDKITSVYDHIPDFGGVIVKGDSEGEPGPLTYGRTHAEGANMFAELLEPHDGIVLWRAFVYGPAVPDPDPDRSKQAYELFEPLDGEFADNVILQTKNGPLDFQPREPFAPLLGGMPETNTGVELPIMKEYTGHSYHANYQIPAFERVFGADTHANGEGTLVSDVLDGSAFGYSHTLVAGVANYGMDTNWTRHPLDQANWFGFGRLAWDPTASAEGIADEWASLTFDADRAATTTITQLLMDSEETYARYAQPLGLPLAVRAADHFKNDVSNRTSFNRDGPDSVGYDRTREGSGYVDQYHEPVADALDEVETTPEELLLFLHHVDYDMVLPHSGETVIQRLYDLTFDGVERAQQQLQTWRGLEGVVDDRRFGDVERLLERQVTEAINFRNLTNRHFHGRSGAEDERGRTDAFAEPTAEVHEQVLRPGDPVEGATSDQEGTVYLVTSDWGGTGKWEQEARLELASDEIHGTSAPAQAGEAADLDAPLRPGSYRLYAVDEYGNVSSASDESVTVLGDEVVFDVDLQEETIVGGQATPAEAWIANGLDRDVDFELTVDAEDGWDSGPVEGSVASGEQVRMEVGVTPPGDVEPDVDEELRFTLTETGGDLEETVELRRSVAPSGDEVALALDAGGTGSPLLDTYDPLTPEDEWQDGASFGWVGGVPQWRDRGGPDDLLRDMVTDQNTVHTLRVAVPPGPHKGYMLVGDAGANFGDTVVSENGEELARIGNDLGGAGNWGWASFEIDGGEDGRMADLEFSPDHASFWRINGLVLIDAAGGQ